jgi:DNA-binding GntR family transcriptional regulator
MGQAPGGARRAQLQVIRSASTRTQVFALLREEIVSVVLPPGADLSEKDLAERYGVSRTPVREAVLRLVDEGLLEVVPQHGTFVSRISVSEVTEMQFVRETLERASLPDAVSRVSAADGVELRAILAEQIEAERLMDVRRWFQSDEQLHRTLLEMAGRNKVWPIVCSAKAHLDRVRMLSLPSKRVLHSLYLEHKEIVERILARDAAGADEVLTHHLRLALETLKTFQVDNPEYFLDEGDVALPRAAGDSDSPR